MTSLIRFSLGFMLVFSALFLIALVLIQRGRGGGLAGAFGGMGGQSAFGTKAGDVFTRITVVVAACWILLCILAINLLGRSESLFSPTLGGTAGQAVPAQTTVPPAAQPAGDSPTEGGSAASATDVKAEPKTDAGVEPKAEPPATSEPAKPEAAAPAAPASADAVAPPAAPAAK
ncbi:MAG: preprotein translocase subunit SecG [Planctomycetia bacterium]|nr:preprotein translocase subunit SecG [Planctomycetia bacterium]